jgi:hypothetical protein
LSPSSRLPWLWSGGDIIESVIRVLLAEDQVMIREALAAQLSSGGTIPRTPREELRVIL